MNKITTFLTLLSVILLLSCSQKKSDAQKEREGWLLSLNDSIASYQKQMEEVSSRLSEAQKEVGRKIAAFEYVSHDREVEGYYILRGWESHYPLQSTGLIARISKNEGLEIIAALTGATFNEIAVSADGNTVTSGVVPHDQALNYRTGSLNRVCFSSVKADSIGCFIAGMGTKDISLIFLEGNPVKAITLDKSQQKMVAETWSLYNSQMEAHRLEREMPRISGKIAACRRMLERDSVTSDN